MITLEGDGDHCLAEGRCSSFNGVPVLHEQFRLDRGLVVFRLRRTGAREFIAGLALPFGDRPVAGTGGPESWNGTFERAWDLVWAEGEYTGAAATFVPRTGRYVVWINGADAWRISVEQVAPDAPVTDARTFAGHGDTVVGLIRFPAGTYAVRATQALDSFFIVTLRTLDGDTVDLPDGSRGLIFHRGPLFGGEGSVNEQNPFEIPTDSVYLLTVTGLGDWTLAFQ